MIVTKAKEALERLRRTNYKQIPDFGVDLYTELLIEILSNECKSTVIFGRDETGEIKSRRYESDIIKNNIDKIVRQLILNGTVIPKDVMNNIICTDGNIFGVNTDVELYKGIEEAEDGSMESVATIGNIIINNKDLDASTISEIRTQIHDKFASQFILMNSKELPKQSRLQLFKEKLLHGKEDRTKLSKKYIEILKEHTNYSEEIIRSTVEYNLDYMYSDKFKTEILNSINNGTSLVALENGKKRNSIDLLKSAISAETTDLFGVMPDINKIHEDISQIYADIETGLVAYSTDITKLDAKQIEEKIKQINHTSLKNPTLTQYLGKNGYRTRNVEIKNNSVELLNKKHVPTAMDRLSKDIYELVQNSDAINQEEYLRRAIGLHYRFIRIHPYPDSNGRTSRALLNMITIPKGILVNFPKEWKREFTMASNYTHQQLDQQEYLKAISENSENLVEMEANQEIEISKFVCNNCIIDTKEFETQIQQSGKEQEIEQEK